MSINAAADAAIAQVSQFTASWPKPGPGQGVRADAALKVLRVLETIAAKIVATPQGTKKAAYGGAGYFTGNTVTSDDHAVAHRILYEVRTRLPSYGTKPLEPWLLAQLHERSQRLLMVATDLELRDEGGKLARLWSSVGEAFAELPKTLGTAAGTALREAGRAAGSAAGGFLSASGLMLPLVGLGVLGGVLLLRR